MPSPGVIRNFRSTALWLGVSRGCQSRPDIANALRACARHSHNPRPRHLKALLQVATYVNATKEIGLRFVRSSGLRLFVYADADYAAASNDRRSVSGVAVMLGDTAIGWKSSTQKSVTTATCEAEYVVHKSGFGLPPAGAEWHASRHFWR